MELISIESSMISEAGYDVESRKLLVRFKRGGSVYEYENITLLIWHQFMNAESKGRFFSENVRSHPELYPYREVID